MFTPEDRAFQKVFVSAIVEFIKTGFVSSFSQCIINMNKFARKIEVCANISANIKLCTNFQSLSNPSTPALNWSTLDKSSSSHGSGVSTHSTSNNKLVPYLRLNGRPTMSSDATLSRKFEFWQRLREQFDYDLIRGFCKVNVLVYVIMCDLVYLNKSLL